MSKVTIEKMPKRQKVSLERKQNLYGYIFVLPIIIGLAAIYIPVVVQSLIYSFSDIEVTDSGFKTVFCGWNNYYNALFVEEGFVRELISNGCDAITKIKKLDMMGEYQMPDDYKPSIQVVVNPDEKTLKFIDTGLGMTAEEVLNSFNKKSGLLGVSGISSDSRDVEDAAAAGDEDAQLAITMYNNRVAKYVADYFIELEGKVDAIVFTAGVGENGREARYDIMSRLAPIGIKIDADVNDSIASYRPAVQNVITIFMILSGINYSAYFCILCKQIKEAFSIEEVRVYLLIILSAVAIICFNTFPYTKVQKKLSDTLFSK